MLTRFKQVARRVLSAAFPETASAIFSARARAHSHRLIQEWGLLDLNHKLADHFGSSVQAGPFKGLLLSSQTHREHLGPYLLGTYEAELHPWLEETAAIRFDQILDIGSKFGYYAVGLSRRSPGVPVVAFDTDWWARAATREMASINRTADVEVAGFCSPRWLDRHLRDESFILADCEGYEGELFSHVSTSKLHSATLLIEIHDNLVPGAGAAVRKRFEATHEIACVFSGKTARPHVDLGFLTEDEMDKAVREYRDPQYWLFVRPRAQ